MREAFGGTFLIKFLLVFVFMYVAFTAVSINYAKAFRLKNKIIDFVEQNEIIDLEKFFANEANLIEINNILRSAKYNIECPNGNGGKKDETNKVVEYCYNGIKIVPDRVENNTQYYTIKTYASWNLNAINLFGRLSRDHQDNPINNTWEITGEAKVVLRKS